MQENLTNLYIKILNENIEKTFDHDQYKREKYKNFLIENPEQIFESLNNFFDDEQIKYMTKVILSILFNFDHDNQYNNSDYSIHSGREFDQIKKFFDHYNLMPADSKTDKIRDIY